MSSTRTWLRAIVLLLALLVPGAHAEAHITVTPVVAATETTEYDVLDTVLRPAARAAVPLRPAPRPAPAPHVPVAAARPRPAPPNPSYSLHTLRTVVLRC